MTVGDLAESLNVSEISWWNIPLTLTQAGVYAVLVVLLARVHGDPRAHSRPPLPSPSADGGDGLRVRPLSLGVGGAPARFGERRRRRVLSSGLRKKRIPWGMG